ncbi:neutral zinc metallopeptidase [Novosphingobium sp.]|uniref:KPN_02809 family neutral zinc metallopeptidase n=1 Tax=Novosphingobium sp. TaxID=1874826 RepID=UPI0027346499|nr:neutral zinc metallopeptidase [Novosphingobium sp.]MDP3908025.1 neutral zinc metallopeptidase [Novosphingobium sp.]
MRLDDFDPNAVNVEDQRGGGGGFRMGGGGGKIGCGTLVIALIAAVVFGVDPTQMLGGLQQMQQAGPEVAGPAQGGSTISESCSVDAMSRETCNALSSLNKTWEPILRASGTAFVPPKLVFYAQSGNSGCGAAQSAMGPFYCPSDNGIYIDTDFYREMEQKLGAGGDFARAYVIAHEYGHHIQTITGISEQIRSAQAQNPQAANRLQVRMELQADCYAGVWAAKNADRIEPGDMEEGLNAAHSIGDDTLMKKAGRRPVEASFTHGTSEQRMTWLKRGLESASGDACDTFADLR